MYTSYPIDLQLRESVELYENAKDDEDSDWSGAEDSEEDHKEKRMENEDGLIYFGDRGCTPEYVSSHL